MIPVYYTIAFIGASIAVLILFLLRRDKLHSRHALWRSIVAFFVLLLGFFPKVLDYLGKILGFSYPPMLGAILGLALLLIRVLLQDIEHTRLERQVRRLVQKIAINEIDELDAR